MNMPDKKMLNLIKYGDTNPGLFKRLFSPATWIPRTPMQFTQPQELHQFWTAIYQYQRATKEKFADTGISNSTVKAVIDLISKTAATAPWSVYRVVDKKKYDRYKTVQKQTYSAKQAFELKRLKEYALEPYDTHYLNRVFQFPNEQQSGAEYMENLLGFKLLTGDSYEMANMTLRDKVAELWVIPSQYIEIKTGEAGSFPMRELAYVFTHGTKQHRYEPKQISHSKYWTPQYNGMGSHLYGLSPLDSVWLSVLEENAAREAAVEILRNRGARGIFTFESDKILEYSQFQEAKGHLKEDWRNGMKDYANDIMPVFGRGQWHNVGLSAKDLMIIDIVEMTKDDICNAYGVSTILLNNHDASTDNNYAHARKELITRAVLPLLGTIRDARNRKLQGDWAERGENIVCDFDQTIFTELDEDKKEIADWMKGAGCFTDNEIRIQLGYEELKGSPLSAEVWKKTSEIPMSMVNENTVTRNNPGNETV